MCFDESDLELTERRCFCFDSLKFGAGPLEEVRSFGFFECGVIGDCFRFLCL